MNFQAKLFITLEYKDLKGENQNKRDPEQTIKDYETAFKSKGINIDQKKFVKFGKSGKHDGYAKGLHYTVTGTYTGNYSTANSKKMREFGIFHDARHDYWNCRPLLSIKEISKP